MKNKKRIFVLVLWMISASALLHGQNIVHLLRVDFADLEYEGKGYSLMFWVNSIDSLLARVEREEDLNELKLKTTWGIPISEPEDEQFCNFSFLESLDSLFSSKCTVLKQSFRLKNEDFTVQLISVSGSVCSFRVSFDHWGGHGGGFSKAVAILAQKKVKPSWRTKRTFDRVMEEISQGSK